MDALQEIAFERFTQSFQLAPHIYQVGGASDVTASLSLIVTMNMMSFDDFSPSKTATIVD